MRNADRVRRSSLDSNAVTLGPTHGPKLPGGGRWRPPPTAESRCRSLRSSFGLSAGGKWIRTIGAGKTGFRLETHFCRFLAGSPSERDALLSRRGTESSNPVFSSEESCELRYRRRSC